MAGHPEDGTGGVELEGAPFGQGLARVEETLGHLAELTSGGRDQDDPMTLGGHAGHGAGGGDSLIVRVGVEEDGSGHAAEANG